MFFITYMYRPYYAPLILKKKNPSHSSVRAHMRSAAQDKATVVLLQQFTCICAILIVYVYDMCHRYRWILLFKIFTMPAHCCAYGCKNRQITGVDLQVFRIPRDPHLRAKWVSAIKRDDCEPTEHSRICAKHFISGK